MKNSDKIPSAAFTLLELVTIIAILALLAGLLTPALAQSKQKAARLNCVNNLKQVGTAFRIWAGSHHDRYPMVVGSANGGPLQQTVIAGAAGAQFSYQIFQVMSNELRTPKVVVCPSDDRLVAYSFSSTLPPGATGYPFTGPNNISYFVGRDADETNPQLFLAGDRNLGVNPGAAGALTPIAFYPLPITVQVGTNTATLATQNFGWTERMHSKAGNVGLADGSVQQFTNARFREAAGQTSDPQGSIGAMRTVSPGGNTLLVP